MKNYHLLPDDGNGWKLTDDRGTRLFTGARTKEEALEKAIKQASVDPGSLRIHREDGTIEEERTYPRRADPRETAG